MNPDYECRLYETATGRYWLPVGYSNDPTLDCIIAGTVSDQIVVDWAARFLKPGDTILDAGCNFGQMSVLFSRMVGPEGCVVAIEANPWTAAKTIINLRLNEASNVELICAAVTNHHGDLVWFPDLGKFHEPSFGAPPISFERQPFSGCRVPTIKVDRLGLTPRVMKFDIQGVDLLGMEGAWMTIQKHKPAIIFEFEPTNPMGHTFENYEVFIQSIDYRLAEQTNILPSYAGNYLAVPV